MSADGKMLKHYVTSKGSNAVDVEFINVDYSLKILDNTFEERKEVDMPDLKVVSEQYKDEPTVVNEVDHNSPVNTDNSVDVEEIEDNDVEEKMEYKIDEETKSEIKKEILEEIKEFIIELLENILK